MLRRGRSHRYWLDRDHSLVQSAVLPAFAGERELRQRALAACVGRLIGYRAAVLFGSVARGQEAWRSDIDLLLLVDDEPARHSLEQQLDEVGFRVLGEYGSDLSPIVLTVDEFRLALANGQPFLRQVLREGILLAGTLPDGEEVA